MGLPALEFSDCYLDSPQFRERLKSHELELDKTNKFIKELIKDGKALIQALKGVSTAKRKFADSLNDFKFQCIGDAETDDEICIAKSLQEFAAVIQNLEDERTRMIENANDVLIIPLERFRKEQISAAKEAKKRYDKETEKYCAVLEKHLSLSAKKKETQLHEADSQVGSVRQHFYEVSLEYVLKVQEVQERKMFDFVEPLLAFLQGLFTYYHHGYELAKDFNHFKTDLTISIQNTRNRFESTRSEVELLMRKMKENPLEHKTVSQHTMEGYLFILEKRSFVSTWVKYYCTYHREPKKVTMVLFDPKSGGKMGEEESFILKSCTRRKTESIEKRFCFDVEAVDRPGVITMQALSEDDRRLWMEAMDGREPVYNLNKDNQAEGMAQLDVIGFNVMKKLIYAVETRGIDEQGLYRIVGVSSKVQKLLSLAMDPKTCADVELDNPEWEIKTITSTIKHYLRMLPAPLMTYQYHRSFIKAANYWPCPAPWKDSGSPLPLKPSDCSTPPCTIKIEPCKSVIFRDVPNCVGSSTNMQPNQSRRKSAENKAPSCSERPLTLFHTPTHSQKSEKRNSVGNTTTNDLQHPVSTSANCTSSSSSSSGSSGSHSQALRHSLTSNEGEQDGRQIRPSSLLNPKPRVSIPASATSPSPTSPRSPSWPMFSAPSSPQPISSASSDSSPGSITGRKARALYACKAEHDSELSFIAGTIFENVHASKEPGWLEGTLGGRTGLIPENYVELL
ncbi:rho GTPase-activating protein 26 [Nematolebias whitei]|uniref:rho GTPase-activating protein 26 n=1 Tax=Nematolebias whitei TaxID=451745 RepID=UPI00189895A0|nr:rho GTPase-activating protein 26 [Nematolebias whitei]